MSEAIRTDYLFRMTDCTGLLQHSVLGIPDPGEGYTSDDNARALILSAMLYERSPEERYSALMSRYLGFLLNAERDGWFRNFMRYDRRFREKRGSEDCFGRCVMAICFTAGRSGIPPSVRDCARNLLERCIFHCSSLTYPKAEAYALTGLSLYSCLGAPTAKRLCRSLSDTYLHHREGEWKWFEDSVTYCGGILPLSLLCCGQEEELFLSIGLESLDFLLAHEFRNGIFLPVGCKEWFPKGGFPALYDEQPVEACNLMAACLKAYRLTEESVYRDAARSCFRWYLGQNIAGVPMIYPQTGGCFDGITPTGINRNQGAESIVCWLLAALLAEREGWYPETP